MGIQTVVVSIGVAVALMIGLIAGTSATGASFGGWLSLGLVPVVSAALYLTERAIGRQIWHFTAPYPYPWMEPAATMETAAAETKPHRDPVSGRVEEMALAA